MRIFFNMKIVCPECRQVHDVPEVRIRALKKNAQMQCARCQAQFSIDEQGAALALPPKKSNINKWLAFILLIVGLGLVLMLLALVAAHNQGKIEFDNLPTQVTVALGEDGPPSAPASSSGLIPTLSKGYKLPRKNEAPILVVKGRLKNTGDTVRTKIILKGTVVGTDGKILFETRAPCGKLISNKRLRKTKRAALPKLFSKNGEYLDCTIPPGGEKAFQMVFHQIPPYFKEDYTINVVPLYAGQEPIDSAITSSDKTTRRK